ncbi:MAG: aminotransferase class I/II-fold pyridoxal phosphate-dependent enzyme [Polyangiaceae bacterium]|nr:aminotransferase class I/II-fold pyridoxal phosphate-dependent enzyme [Polyangiaceae bacterium]MCE7888624.1 aminotransferase class I/II-fold pyridoxal phosphate-dependent enzyme [Sorangiineae bacterium PRO1]MCL4749771.1 aminotransferase class I/II-fold pyridoxal phosphate-dependent enzyme [Myxococcales bacterium]
MDGSKPGVHLNLNVWGLGRSPTIAIDARSRELAAAGHRIYRFGLGQSPFPVPAPVVAALREHAPVKDYLPVEGLPALREAVARYYCLRGVERTAQDILVGPGSKELMFLLQLTFYGDLVIPTPSWVSYAPQAQIVGRPIRWVPTTAEDGWPLTPAELDRVCRDEPEKPRLVVLNYPANPTGQTYDVGRLEELAAVARRYRALLLSDEIYGELHHQGLHESVARFYPEGTIVSSGLSKWCGAGGWRLGTFAFPPTLAWLREAMAAVASETFTSTSAPIQYAAVTAFEVGAEIQQYLRSARRVLRAFGALVHRELVRAGAEVAEPCGGFYVFPDFGPLRQRLRERGIETSTELCERLLLETGVALLPGLAFGRPPEELTARLAYVDFDGALALVAARALEPESELDEGFVAQQAPRLVEGLSRLTEWCAAR